YIDCQVCSTCIGSLPTTKSRKSSMQAMAAPALPSSVPSPQPTSPWLVSSLTNTYGRSDVRVSDTPKTFIPVTFRPDWRLSKAPPLAPWGAKEQPQASTTPRRVVVFAASPAIARPAPPNARKFLRSMIFLQRRLVHLDAQAGASRKLQKAIVCRLQTGGNQRGTHLAVGRSLRTRHMLDEEIRYAGRQVQRCRGGYRTAVVVRRDRHVIGLARTAMRRAPLIPCTEISGRTTSTNPSRSSA